MLKDILLLPGLVMLSSAIYALFVGVGVGDVGVKGTAARESFAYILVWIACYAALGAAAFLASGKVLAKFASAPLVVFLLAWLIFPTYLSYAPVENLQQLAYLAMTVLFSAVLVSVYTREEFIKRLVVVAEIAVVLTIIGIFFGPKGSQFDMENVRAIRGFFPHKSIMGNFFFAMLTLYMFAWPKDWKSERQRLRRYIFGGGALVLLFLSNDVGSMVATMVAVGAYFLLRSWRRDALASSLLLLAGVMAGIIIITTILPLIFSLLGRSMTLTGRTEIWSYWWMFASEHPIMGYGYAGFFGESPLAPGRALWRFFLYYKAPGFHNTFLDAAIQGGIVVAVVVFFLMARTWFLYVKNALSGHDFSLWAVSFLTAFSVTCMVSTLILAHNALSTVLFFYLVFDSVKAREHISMRA